MSFSLGENSYGKSEVRVVKVTRSRDAHALRDLTVDVRLLGSFADAHLSGENHDLPATDTMRNVVYACAAEHDLLSVPAFAAELGTRLLDLSPLVERVEARLRERPWTRLDAYSWQGGAGGTRLHTVTVEGDAEADGDTGAIAHRGGIEDLLVLRSAGSAFRGFQRDRYTSLPETDDRILATVVMGEWEHLDPPAEEDWARTRDALLRSFTDHFSPSVQFTLHQMGSAALAADPNLARITLRLPNRHHLPFDVARFGVEEAGEVFHATTEPYGLIEATVERS